MAVFKPFWMVLLLFGTLSSACDVTYTESPGTISSPNYPSLYPANSLCTYSIMAPYDYYITLKFIDMDIAHTSTCTDKLTIYDGDSLACLVEEFCENDFLELKLDSANVILKFETAGNTGIWRGFKISYDFVDVNMATTDSLTTLEFTEPTTTESETDPTDTETTADSTTIDEKETTPESLTTEFETEPLTITEMVTELMTTAVDEITTVPLVPTELITTRKPPTEPSVTEAPPPVSGPLAPPEYPETPGQSVEKRLEIMIKVLNAPDGCLPSDNETSQACQDFILSFENDTEAAYIVIRGFGRILVTGLSESLIKDGENLIHTLYVDHEVIYIWNDMDSTDRGLTADEVYALTIASYVDAGIIGGLTLDACPECVAPAETTSICVSAAQVSCNPDTYMDPYCIDGLPVCLSQCLNTANPYCNVNHGICSQQDSGVEAQCSCLQTDDVLYFGDRCQRSVNKIGVYIGVAAVGFIIVTMIAVLAVCLLSARSKNQKLIADGLAGGRRDSGEETLGIYNYGIANEAYDPKKPTGEIQTTFQKSMFTNSSETGDNFDDVFLPRATTVNGYASSPVRHESYSRDDPAFWGNLSEGFQIELQQISDPFAPDPFATNT